MTVPSTTEAARGGLARRLVRMEGRIYTSIARAVACRPAIEQGASGFSYHRPVRTILIIFIVLSAVEIPVIDLIAHRWPPVRIALLVVGIWGLTWMIGLLCAYLMRPHTVGPRGIRVRDGLEIDIDLPWDDVASVARVRHIAEHGAPRVTRDVDGRATLSLSMQDETAIEIALERPVSLDLPGRAPKGGRHEVDAVRIWVDDVDGFMAAVARHIP